MNSAPAEATTHHLHLPITEAQSRSLKAGDLVYLYGDIAASIGLPAHQRILECIESGKPLPFDLRGSAFFHLSSYNRESNGEFEVLYLNPSTSTRFNAYMPKLIRALDLRMVGGKGGLDAASTQAMKEVGCVYLSFLGGGCTLLSQALRGVVEVGWTDLIPQYRLAKLRVEALGPATVGIDAHGMSLYDDLQQQARRKLPEILQALAKERDAAPKA